METKEYVVTGWFTTAEKPKPIVISFIGKEISHSKDVGDIFEGRGTANIRVYQEDL